MRTHAHFEDVRGVPPLEAAPDLWVPANQSWGSLHFPDQLSTQKKHNVILRSFRLCQDLKMKGSPWARCPFRKVVVNGIKHI